MQICWAHYHIYARKLFPNLHLYIMVPHISSLPTAPTPESIAPNANQTTPRRQQQQQYPPDLLIIQHYYYDSPYVSNSNNASIINQPASSHTLYLPTTIPLAPIHFSIYIPSPTPPLVITIISPSLSSTKFLQYS